MFQRQRIGHSTGYLTDESKMTGRADNVLLPYSEQELREILRVYNSKGTPVTIAAMRTGVSGGSVPNGGDVLSLEHMKGAVGIGKDERGYFLRVLPCTTLDEIDDILTVTITGKPIEDEDAAMESSDWISEVVNTLKVVDD